MAEEVVGQLLAGTIGNAMKSPIAECDPAIMWSEAVPSRSHSVASLRFRQSL